jgi:VIT1/CCC1 family predicted Fe2+/Mn2+ transporter
MEKIEKNIIKEIAKIQKGEIDGYFIYKNLAASIKDKRNSAILSAIANEELNHFNLLKTYTHRDIKHSKIKVLFFILLAKFLGITFTLKLMEINEAKTRVGYRVLKGNVKELDKIIQDEDRHEAELLNMLKEDKLNYAGSIVLGLNDALVELTGVLAGFTFVIQNSRIIAFMGFITGIAATLSMAASGFLSQRQDSSIKESLKSSFYTGSAYLITVILLIFPFFTFSNPFLNLAIMFAIAILIILAFNYYISVAKSIPFKKRFIEMSLISTSVAIFSFGIGWAVKTFFGFEI